MNPTPDTTRRPLRPEELFDEALKLKERAEKAEAEAAKLREQNEKLRTLASHAIEAIYATADPRDPDPIKFRAELTRLAPAPEESVTKCDCRSCIRVRQETINGLPAENFRMIVCKKCGNKRCPKAENCKFKCTDSNALDQIGELEEPAPEWRELGPDEVICEGDKYRSDVSFTNWPVTSVMIGKPARSFPEYNIRTNRPLPKPKEEMPLERQINYLKENGDGLFADCFRYLRDEIQKLKQSNHTDK